MGRDSDHSSVIEAHGVMVHVDFESCKLIAEWRGRAKSVALEGKFVVGVWGERVLVALCEGTQLYHSMLIHDAWQRVFNDSITASSDPRTPGVNAEAVVLGARYCVARRGKAYSVDIEGDSGTFGPLDDHVLEVSTRKLVVGVIRSLLQEASS